MSEEAKRVWSECQDFTVMAPRQATETKPTRIFRAVIFHETVAAAVATSTNAIVMTPVREMVNTTPTQARTSAPAAASFTQRDIRADKAATKTGVVAQKKKDRLFESSIVP